MLYINIYKYVVYLQLWTLHTLFVTLLPPNRREAPPIYVSELPSQNKRACMMKVAVWRLTHLKDGPDNFQSPDWCVPEHQVLLILGKWLEFCVSCNRRSIFQLHKRHRSEKRTRPETNATKKSWPSDGRCGKERKLWWGRRLNSRQLHFFESSILQSTSDFSRYCIRDWEMTLSSSSRVCVFADMRPMYQVVKQLCGHQCLRKLSMWSWNLVPLQEVWSHGRGESLWMIMENVSIVFICILGCSSSHYLMTFTLRLHLQKHPGDNNQLISSSGISKGTCWRCSRGHIHGDKCWWLQMPNWLSQKLSEEQHFVARNY